MKFPFFGRRAPAESGQTEKAPAKRIAEIIVDELDKVAEAQKTVDDSTNEIITNKQALKIIQSNPDWNNEKLDEEAEEGAWKELGKRPEIKECADFIEDTSGWREYGKNLLDIETRGPFLVKLSRSSQPEAFLKPLSEDLEKEMRIFVRFNDQEKNKMGLRAQPYQYIVITGIDDIIEKAPAVYEKFVIRSFFDSKGWTYSTEQKKPFVIRKKIRQTRISKDYPSFDLTTKFVPDKMLPIIRQCVNSDEREQHDLGIPVHESHSVNAGRNGRITHKFKFSYQLIE